MRHVWSGLHDGCESCMGDWIIPTRTITAREALERWPAPGAPSRRKAVATPSPKGSRQHRSKGAFGQNLSPRKVKKNQEDTRPAVGYIYAVRVSAGVKVGYTADTVRRYRQLHAGEQLHRIPVDRRGGMWVEMMLHRQLAQWRVSGETYRLSDAEVATIPLRVAALVARPGRLAHLRLPVGRPKKEAA